MLHYNIIQTALDIIIILYNAFWWTVLTVTKHLRYDLLMHILLVLWMLLTSQGDTQHAENEKYNVCF